ncbi:MAG: hypothetical protein CL762_01350 [Chloroflexi bacterium]|nr:hypothetical protein [Chloroflexota bacterium]|tara:strand:- start:473 stop:694 length:222 start_codon:yes stop_codon:yes gene_type:complete
MKKNFIIFGKITGLGWFVVIITIGLVLVGRWIGSFIGSPILFASIGGLIGIVVSYLGIRSSIREILNNNGRDK